MTEKTIWPEWIRLECNGLTDMKMIKYDTAQTIYYDNLTNVMVGHNDKRYGYTHYANVSKEEMNTFNDKLIDHIATPSECEARKKELQLKETVELSGKNADVDNPWIPGNEPEKEGWYELTLKNKAYSIDFYTGEIWMNLKRLGFYPITAYKKINTSNPYQPPEPERELLCPFGCDGHIQISRFKACGYYYWYCAESGCRGRDEKEKENCIKHLHKTYDKLNK